MTTISTLTSASRDFGTRTFSTRPGSRELAEKFYAEVAEKEPVLHEALRRYIDGRGTGFEKRAASKVLTDSAPFLSDFIARLFGITRERAELEREILRQNPIWKYKFFVQRRAAKAFTPDSSRGIDHNDVYPSADGTAK